ncbi:MAG: hypothetical protein ABIJ75_10540, partial [Actinomycetota bacterium]
MNVTIKDLTDSEACRPQIDLFEKTFGGKVRVTRRALLRAARVGLDLEWFVREFLAPLWAEYERQRASLLAEYKRQRAPLWAEYERQSA